MQCSNTETNSFDINRLSNMMTESFLALIEHSKLVLLHMFVSSGTGHVSYLLRFQMLHTTIYLVVYTLKPTEQEADSVYQSYPTQFKAQKKHN
jgi:hypothetical protein